MSASITATFTGGSNGVQSGGKQIVGTLSGGTGTGYAITDASNLIVAFVYDGSRSFYVWIESVSVVGNVFTIDLSTVIPSGADTYIGVPTSVTITDSGGNTPVGQDPAIFDNNSTASLTYFASDDASVADVCLDISGPSSYQGHSYRAPQVADAAMWEFTYDGTDLWMPIYPYDHTTAVLQITVDGSPVSPVPQLDSQFFTVPILNGASAGPHKIQVLVKNISFFFDVSHTFYGNGTLSAATTDDDVSYGKVHNLWESPSYVGRSKGMNRWSSGLPLLLTTGMDGQLRFKTTGGSGGATHEYALTVVAQIGSSNLQKFWIALRLDGNGDLWINHNALGGAIYMLTIDGVEQTPFSVLTDSVYRWELLATGLDATAIDEAATWSDRWNILAAGDSVFAAWLNVGTGTSQAGDWHQLSTENDWDVQNLGQPGAHAPTAGLLQSNQPEPDVICYGWVTNDLAKDPAVTQSEWTSLLTSTRTQCPDAKIVVRKCLPNSFSNPSAVVTQNNAVAAAIAAIGDANTIHIDVSAGLVSGDYVDGDTHPGPTGYVKIKNNEIGYLSPPPSTPATPTSFAITAIDATGMTVGWTGSANAGSFTDLTYQIERSTNGTDFTFLTYITGTSYKDTTTVNGVTYYYRVYASSAEFGESAVTDSDSGVAQGPVFPDDTTPPTLDTAVAIADGTSVVLTFDEDIEDNTAISGLSITAFSASIASAELTDTDEITLTLSGALEAWESPAVSYFPGNLTDTSDNALEAFSNFPIDNSGNTNDPAPAAPQGLTLATSDGQITVSWLNNPPGDFDHYELEQSTDGENFTLVDDTITDSSFDVTGLDNGTRYYFRIRAVDSASQAGAYSEISSGVAGAHQRHRRPPLIIVYGRHRIRRHR